MNQAMKKTLSALAALVILLGLAGAAGAQTKGRPENTLYTVQPEAVVLDEATGQGYINNMMLVFVKEGVGEEELLSFFPGEEAKIMGRFPLLHQYQVQVKPRDKAGLEQLAHVLMKRPQVRYAHLDLAAFSGSGNSRQSEEPADYPMEGPPILDSLPQSQWWQEAIRMKEAQALMKGPYTIKAGVVDDGFDMGHPALNLVFPGKEQEQQNYAEFHGTHVAGIIQQILPGAPITVLDSYRIPELDPMAYVGTVSLFLKHLVDMVEAGVQVINYSMGFDIWEDEKLPWNSEMGQVISVYMWLLMDQGQRFMVVQSAGNSGIDADRNGMFCAITPDNALGSAEVQAALGISDRLQAEQQKILDSILVVTATDKKDREGDYFLPGDSNFGKTVTLAAPGEDIISAVPGGFRSSGGTSQAAPMVTAAAAMVWSVNPALTPGQVKEILINSATEQVKDKTAERSPQDLRSYPLLNLEEALTMSQASLTK
ncbi:MAG: S8 family serine peptidase [Clostridiales bacterium]|nr:S8 family serine peptidase [Clostridiales bacterium]